MNRLLFVMIATLVLYLILQMKPEAPPPSIRRRYLRQQEQELEQNESTFSTDEVERMFAEGALG